MKHNPVRMTPSDHELFRTIRMASGRTQRQLAASLKVSVRQVQRWEAGDRAIPGPVTVLMEQLAQQGFRRMVA